MAALAIPPLEAGAMWLLGALGLTATATTAVVLSKSGSKDEADTGSTTVVIPRTRTRDRKCKCPPDAGTLAPVNHSMSAMSATYQTFVTGLPSGLEWNYAGIDFDGFQSETCLLQEAKAEYDQFFEKNGLPKFFFLISNKDNKKPGWTNIMGQAARQNDVVVVSAPADLYWYFMTPLMYRFSTREFALSGFVIVTRYFPLPT